MTDEKTESEGLDLAVFVYGTLKPGGRYHRQYCDRALAQVVPAMTKGLLYDFPTWGYPAMVSGEGWVKGCLLLFKGEAAVCNSILQGLDRLEGVDDGPPNLEKAELTALYSDSYYRCQQSIFTLTREPLQSAWVYLMTSEQVRHYGGLIVASGDWPIPAGDTSR